MNRVEMFTLRTAREIAGLNQAEAASMLEVSPDTLRNYESGKTQPDVLMIKKIEALYNIPFDRLIFLNEDNGKTVKGKEEP